MGFSQKIRGRCWLATVQIANMENLGLTKEQYENPEYLASYLIKLWEDSGNNRKAGAVVCVSFKGLYHVHMACYGNTTTLKKVSDILGKSHVEPQLGGKKELKEYLLKEGVYEEKGEQVLCCLGLDNIQEKQGKRSDLEEIEELLNDGLRPEEIFEIAFRYRKYEKMIKSAYLSKRIKESPLIKETWHEWHWGKPGTGKTYTYIKLCEKYSIDEVYLCNDYANASSSGGGFDFYANNPARIIVLDEFRGGGMTYSQLLSLLDKFSRNQQHCRYQNVYQLWESVIVCSIFPPEQVYKFMVEETQRSTDSIQQLMRRLNVIVYHYINEDGKYRTFEMPASDYISAEDMIMKALKNEKYADELEEFCNSDMDDTETDNEQIKEDFGMVEVKE